MAKRRYRKKRKYTSQHTHVEADILVLGLLVICIGILVYQIYGSVQIQLLPYVVAFVLISSVLLYVFFQQLYKFCKKVFLKLLTKYEYISWAQAAEQVGFIQAMDPTQAEKCIAGIFVKLGYAAELTSVGPDGGIDGILKIDGKKYALQVKRYASHNTVGVDAVRNFRGSYADDTEISGGFFVTTSSYTAPAYKWVEGRNITLWDAKDIAKYLQQVNSR